MNSLPEAPLIDRAGESTISKPPVPLFLTELAGPVPGEFRVFFLF
jgi:hypothetical protein